jgi:hypothetical protein
MKKIPSEINMLIYEAGTSDYLLFQSRKVNIFEKLKHGVKVIIFSPVSLMVITILSLEHISDLTVRLQIFRP